MTKHHASTTNGKRAGTVLLLLLVANLGCDGTPKLAALARAVGVAEAPPAPPLTYSILCDASAQSTCSMEALGETLDAVLPRAATSPGSVVELWSLGGTLEDTTVIASRTSDAPRKRTSHAVRAAAQQFVRDARAFFLAAARPVIEAPANKRSPIVEGIARVAYARASTPTRHLIVISDAREFSALGDWECGELPTEKQLRKRLAGARLLQPGSLAGMTVAFSFVTIGPTKRSGCAVTFARALAIQNLWTVVLRDASATNVRFTPDAVQLDPNPSIGGAR